MSTHGKVRIQDGSGDDRIIVDENDNVILSGSTVTSITSDTVIGDTVMAGTEMLRVTNGSVLFDGSTGAVPVSGAGVRFEWCPAKRALRAGEVTGTQWDDINVGLWSTAFGYNTTASGIGSFAVGYNTSASGDYSAAFGLSSSATLLAEQAFGQGTFTDTSGICQTAFIRGMANALEATPVELTLDGNTPDVGNRIYIADSKSIDCIISAVARCVAGTDIGSSATWTMFGSIERTGAVTRLIGSPFNVLSDGSFSKVTFTPKSATGSDAGLLTMTLVPTADDVNESFKFTFTGHAGSVTPNMFDVAVAISKCEIIENTANEVFLQQVKQILAAGTVSAFWGADYSTSVTPAFFDNVVGCSVVGTAIAKTAVSGAWDAGASSVQRIPGDGYVEFTLGDLTCLAIGGLATSDPDRNYTSINYALFYGGGNPLSPYELGTPLAAIVPFVSLTRGDTIRIQRVGTTITYWYNGVLKYTSLVASTGTLMFDCSILTQNGGFDSVTLSGATGSSGRVTLLGNQTGLAYDLTQATAAKQPLLVRATIPYLEFDGARVLAGVPIPLGATFSTIVVADPVVEGASAAFFSIGNVGSDGTQMYRQLTQFLTSQINTPPIYENSREPAYTLGSPQVLESKFDGTKLYCRGTGRTWSAGTAASMTSPTTGTFLGGINAAPASGSKGRIYAVIVSSPVLTSAQYAKLYAAINARYGVLQT